MPKAQIFGPTWDAPVSRPPSLCWICTALYFFIFNLKRLSEVIVSYRNGEGSKPIDKDGGRGEGPLLMEWPPNLREGVASWLSSMWPRSFRALPTWSTKMNPRHRRLSWRWMAWRSERISSKWPSAILLRGKFQRSQKQRKDQAVPWCRGRCMERKCLHASQCSLCPGQHIDEFVSVGTACEDQKPGPLSPLVPRAHPCRVQAQKWTLLVFASLHLWFI